MEYAWNRGRSVPAQVFGEAVERLSDENGGVCPTWAVVDEARPHDNALHPMFEWDDLAAAESYRREQARHHLRELRIVRVDEEGEPEQVQALVHIVRVGVAGPVEGYRLTALVVEDDDEREQMLSEAKSGLLSWRRRYSHLSQLGRVFEVIDDLT